MVGPRSARAWNRLDVTSEVMPFKGGPSASSPPRGREGRGVGKEAGYRILRVRKRPWYVWLLRVAWMLWLLIWLEFAIGSRQELEEQAFATAVKVLIVSVLLGLALYSWKLRYPGKGAKGEEGPSRSFRAGRNGKK